MKKAAPFFIVVGGAMWGLMGLFVRHLNSMGLSSPTICEIRALSTTVIMALVLIVYDRKLFGIRLKDIWIFAGGGIFSIVFFNVCYFKAIEIMSLSAAAILMYTSPVFVLVFSAILFKEKITKKKILAIVLTFAGCALVGGILSGDTRITWFGLLCGLGSGVGYALYSIFSRLGLMRGYKPLTITFYIFLFDAVGSAFIADFTELGSCVAANPASILYFLFYAAFTTVVPYLLYTIGLRYVENSKASVIVADEPVVATVVGLVLYSEKPTASAIIGILLVLTAIFLMSRYDKKTESF